MSICPTKAIKISNLSYSEDIIELPENNITGEGFIKFLANRRSIRNFKDKPVEDIKINKILDSINFAPFGAEPEKVNITIINNRKKIETVLPHIEKFLDKIVSLLENPISTFIMKKKINSETFNTIKNHLYPISKAQNYKLKYGDRITRNAPAIIVFHAEKDAEAHTHNILIYATYTMLAAHSLGLGATMIGIVPPAINEVKEVKSFFQIPKSHEAVMSLIVGYPKYKYKRSIKRKCQKINWIK